MGIEDVTIPTQEDVLNQMGDAIMADLFGEQVQANPEVVPDNVQQPQEQEAQSENVVEDIPNASIRLDKMKAQRDEERQRVLELEKKLARMEGQMEATKPQETTESDVDPTEYMSDVEKELYLKNKALQEQVDLLAKGFSSIEQQKKEESLTKQENQFFENNPELKERREDVVNEVLDYLKDKPEIKTLLRDSKLNISEIYGMVMASKPQSTKVVQKNDPSKVFSNHDSSVASGAADQLDSNHEMKKAIGILRDRESTNKAQAANFMLDAITKDISSSLGLPL